MVPNNERIVREPADEAADERADDGHPPPAMAGGKHTASPPGHRREQTRTKIARRVDRVASVEPERHADRDDEQADDHRRDGRFRRRVAPIAQREQHRDEQRRPDDLVDQAAGHDAQKFLRIGGPDARRRVWTRDLPHAAVEMRERFAVGHKHDGRRRERARHLRGAVRRDFSPRKSTVRRERHGDGRVEMRARHTGGGVHTHHDRQTPPEIDRQIVACSVPAQDNLSDDADAEYDQDERPEEFRRGFANQKTTSRQSPSSASGNEPDQVNVDGCGKPSAPSVNTLLIRVTRTEPGGAGAPACGGRANARNRIASARPADAGSGTAPRKQPLLTMRNAGTPRSESYQRSTPPASFARTANATAAFSSAVHASTNTNRPGSGILPDPGAASSAILPSRRISWAASA